MKIDLIKPDENQPRRYFDEAKLGELQDSIKEHGIINPLTVQKQEDGSYLLVDGERRFRAATNLKLKEVPVNEIEPKDDKERLLYQFHIQEHHQNWTTLEKAYAMKQLADAIGTTMNEVCEMLGIKDRSVRDAYKAFLELADPDQFQKHNVSVFWTDKIVQLVRRVKKLYEQEDWEFDLNEQKRIEKAIIKRIGNGQILTRTEIVKLKDSFQVDPNVIEEFITTNVSPDDLFRKTGAKGQKVWRNSVVGAGFLAGNISGFLHEHADSKVVKPGETDINSLRAAYRELDKLLAKVDPNH